jgi:SM-20-related protein
VDAGAPQGAPARGELRIYDGDAHTDVDPIGGTMACFLSRVSEHEVMESHTERFSLAGWFKVRPR